jgi:ubiquinone/menaquinone biosynthesis C-methylase UbiE
MTNNDINIWSAEWQKDSLSDFNKLFRNRLFIEVYEVLRKCFNIKDDSKLLEIGAGTGRFGIRFTQENPTLHVTLSDPTESSVKLMKEYVRKYQLGNIDIVKCYGESLPFDDKTFDMVFSDVVLQHIEEPLKVVEEVNRVLKDDGFFVLTLVNKFNPFHSGYKIWKNLCKQKYDYGYEKSYTHSSLESLLSSGGFKVIKKDGAYPAYGLYRLKYKMPLVGLMAKIINRATKFIDSYTNGFVRRNFGFEIVAVAKKYESKK